MATFTVGPTNVANSFYAPGNYLYTNYVTSNVTINNSGLTYAPPKPDTPEKWLRRRVKEVCELAAG